MATINGVDKMSYAELLKLQERIEAAIAEKRVEDAAETKEALRAMAEKAGFDIKELFGKRGAKRHRRRQISQSEGWLATWTGRGRKPNWLVDAVKKGAKLDSFKI